MSRQTLHSYIAVGTAGASSELLVAMLVMTTKREAGSVYDSRSLAEYKIYIEHRNFSTII